MTRIQRWLWQSLKIVALVAVIGTVVYQFKFAPVPVSPYEIERGTVVAEVMGTGTLEARIETTISPKISGRVVELLVDQGQRVTQDDLLVRLDDEELQQQVAIAVANVDAASAAIERLKTDKERAIAVYRQAKKSYDRVQSLIEKNAASRDDADKAIEALAVSESGLARAEAGIAEGQKEWIAAEQTSQYHSARLKDTEIRAPFDGLVVKRIREPGDVVVPGSSILTLISTDELWIRAWVDETEMSRLETDQPARVVFRSEPAESYTGKVARLGREADRETREFIVDVHVFELPKNWAVGQRAETFVKVVQRDDVLVLPAKLLVSREGESGVFVDEDGVADWRVVEEGARSRETIEVLSGLIEGDVVVTPVKTTAKLTQGRRMKRQRDNQTR